MRILAAEVDIFMESKHDELSRRARLWGAALLAVTAAVVIMIAVGRTQTRAAAKARENVEEGCQLIQTIHYARCGHDVTRRVAADKEYKGCTLQQMQQAFSDWSITSFSPSEIEMSCTMQLYCPEHLVVMPDGAGVLGISRETVRRYHNSGDLVPAELSPAGHPRWIEEDVREQMRRLLDRLRERADEE